MISEKTLQYRKSLQKLVNSRHIDEVTGYTSYKSALDIPSIIDNVLHYECTPFNAYNGFNVRKGLIPDIEGKSKDYIASYIKLDNNGNPQLYNDTYNHTFWITYNKNNPHKYYYVKEFDFTNAEKLTETTKFGSDALIDKNKERIYNPVTNTIWSLPKRGASDYCWITADLPEKHGLSSSMLDTHSISISKLYTDTRYKEKKNNSRDCFFRGIKDIHTQSFIHTKEVIDNITYEFSSDKYRVVIDLDNTYRYKLVKDALKKCKFGPQLIITKNKHSKNRGSGSAVVYFDKPLSSDEKKNVVRIFTNYIISNTDTLTIDPNCKNAVMFQNPTQLGDDKSANSLCHDVDIKLDKYHNPVIYKFDQFIEWGQNLHNLFEEEDYLKILQISYDKKLLNSNKRFSDIIKSVSNNTSNKEVWSNPYVWQSYVPKGVRNDVTRLELIQVINEFLASKYGKDIPENTDLFAHEVAEFYFYNRASKLFENSDSQVTLNWVYKRAKALIKWMKKEQNKNPQSTIDSIKHCINICNKLNWSFLSEIEGKSYDESIFKTGKSLFETKQTSKKYSIKAQRGNNTKTIKSLFVAIVRCAYENKLDNVLKATKNAVNANLSDDALIKEISNIVRTNFNCFSDQETRSGGLKTINLFLNYNRAIKEINNMEKLEIANNISLYSISQARCVSQTDLESGTLPDPITGVVTSSTRLEENDLNATVLSSFINSSTNEEISMFCNKLFVCICEKIINAAREVAKDPKILSEFINKETGEIITRVDYRAVDYRIFKDKVIRKLWSEYNIPTTLIHSLILRCIQDFKSDIHLDNGEITQATTEYNLKFIKYHDMSNNFVKEVKESVSQGISSMLIRSALQNDNYSEEFIIRTLKSINAEDITLNAHKGENASIITSNCIYSKCIQERSLYSTDEFIKHITSESKHIINNVKKLIGKSYESFKSDFNITNEDLLVIKTNCNKILKNILQQLSNSIWTALQTLSRMLKSSIPMNLLKTTYVSMRAELLIE